MGTIRHIICRICLLHVLLWEIAALIIHFKDHLCFLIFQTSLLPVCIFMLVLPFLFLVFLFVCCMICVRCVSCIDVLVTIHCGILDLVKA